MTLLERAKAVKPRLRHSLTPTADEIDLMLAFVNGEVAPLGVATALGWPLGEDDNVSGKVRNWAMTTLLGAVRESAVKVARR